MSKFTKGIFYSILLTAGSIPAVSADEVFHEAVNQSLPFWSVIPFVVMLLAVAFVPLINGLWWAKNTKWVSLGCALFFLIPFSYAYGISEGIYRLLESILLDFIPFIVLLYGLYATAGGIMIHGKLAGTPIINSLILFVGTVMASWIGTTGAAMLFIRPLIRVNEWRKEKAHVMVFLIFLVANMGGCLTPLGDPPLFMGFQRGVPFTWTFHLFPILMLNLILLFIAFYFIDRHYFKKELAAGRQPSDMQLHDNSPLVKIYGKKNFFYILLIIVGVMANNFLPEAFPFFANGAGIPIFEEIVFPYSTLVEIILILTAAQLSIHTTPANIHKENQFSMNPIKGVAVLFSGIFVTMIPALVLLETHGSALGINQPWQMFWITGALSSFLDNTPTYLVFLQTAGSLGATSGVITSVGTVAPVMLEAISAGAVFMGANTYIGNAPNFMVKAIAEDSHIHMPGFFAYIGWSLEILFPVFILDTLLFYL